MEAIGATPWAVIAGLVSILSMAVSALAHRRAVRQPPDGDDDDDATRAIAALSERLAVLATRIERAEHDIANDKEGRRAFIASQIDLKGVATRLDELAKTITSLTTQQGRQSENLSRVHERIDDLHHLVANLAPRVVGAAE